MDHPSVGRGGKLRSGPATGPSHQAIASRRSGCRDRRDRTRRGPQCSLWHPFRRGRQALQVPGVTAGCAGSCLCAMARSYRPIPGCGPVPRRNSSRRANGSAKSGIRRWVNDVPQAVDTCHANSIGASVRRTGSFTVSSSRRRLRLGSPGFGAAGKRRAGSWRSSRASSPSMCFVSNAGSVTARYQQADSDAGDGCHPPVVSREATGSWPWQSRIRVRQRGCSVFVQ